MCCSAFFTSIMYSIVKYLYDFSVYQIILFNSLVSLFVIILFSKNLRDLVRTKKKKLMFLRGFFGILSMIFFFLSIKNLELGTAVSLRYTSPVFASLLAVFMLKETINIRQYIFLFISLFGVFIIKGFGYEIDPLGFIFALTSAIFLGLVFVITRKIGNNENPLIIIFYFVLMSFFFGVIMSPNNWITPSFFELSLLLTSGFLSFLGLFFLTKSFQFAKVNAVSSFKYLEVFFSVVISVFFFKENYDYWTILGVILILFGINYRLFNKYFSN